MIHPFMIIMDHTPRHHDKRTFHIHIQAIVHSQASPGPLRVAPTKFWSQREIVHCIHTDYLILFSQSLNQLMINPSCSESLTQLIPHPENPSLSHSQLCQCFSNSVNDQSLTQSIPHSAIPHSVNASATQSIHHSVNDQSLTQSIPHLNVNQSRALVTQSVINPSLNQSLTLSISH